jgi:hypothetical protein
MIILITFKKSLCNYQILSVKESLTYMMWCWWQLVNGGAEGHKNLEFQKTCLG